MAFLGSDYILLHGIACQAEVSVSTCKTADTSLSETAAPRNSVTPLPGVLRRCLRPGVGLRLIDPNSAVDLVQPMPSGFDSFLEGDGEILPGDDRTRHADSIDCQ